jgi:hypothetical protein
MPTNSLRWTPVYITPIYITPIYITRSTSHLTQTVLFQPLRDTQSRILQIYLRTCLECNFIFSHTVSAIVGVLIWLHAFFMHKLFSLFQIKCETTWRFCKTHLKKIFGNCKSAWLFVCFSWVEVWYIYIWCILSFEAAVIKPQCRGYTVKCR